MYACGRGAIMRRAGVAAAHRLVNATAADARVATREAVQAHFIVRLKARAMGTAHLRLPLFFFFSQRKSHPVALCRFGHFRVAVFVRVV